MSDRKPSATHAFIDHPKWAFVIACLLLLIGYQALSVLQIRRFPDIPTGQVTITAVYPGAAAELMQTQVTQPLQRAIATAEGIDYLASTTQDSLTTIEAHLKVGASIDETFNTILAQIQAANADLPPDMDPPIIKKGTANSIALMYVAYAFNNENPSDTPSQLYQYLNTVVRPILSTIPGMGQINILGASPPAARIWLDPLALHQYHIDPAHIAAALQSQNFSVPSGTFEEGFYQQPLRLNTQLHSTEELAALPIAEHEGQIIRLSDLTSSITIGSADNDSLVLFNNQVGVFLSIDALPSANATDLIRLTRERLESLKDFLPPQMTQKIVYDATLFIQDSINEVFKTIIEASLIVVAVIYLFLRSARAVIVPIAAIPLSLLGMIGLMPLFGMSLNLLTLLAMILAIGLVVDDAILVVEHYMSVSKSHAELSVFERAKKTIDDLYGPLVIMTIILALAFSPLIVLSGLTGALFREFAVTLAGSVLISGLVAITISPVFCAVLFQKQQHSLQDPSWLRALRRHYDSTLLSFFDYKKEVVSFVGLIALLIPVMLLYTPQELAPAEDQGFSLISYKGPNNASLAYLKEHSAPLVALLKNYPITQDFFLIHGAGGSAAQGFGGLIATPWSQRTLSMQQASHELQKDFAQISGLEIFGFTPSALPTPDGLPFQWVIYGPHDFDVLYNTAQEAVKTLSQTGYFPFITTNFQFRKMNCSAALNRDRILLAGSDLLTASKNILLSLTDQRSSRLFYKNDVIDCIIRLEQRPLEPFITSAPLSFTNEMPNNLQELSHWDFKAEPNIRPMFNQMPSVTIQGALYPTADLNTLLDITTDMGESLKAQGYFNDYTGPTRSYIQEKGQLLKTGLLALIVIYLALLALYETWVDPLLILLTVPLALSGAIAAMLATSVIPGVLTVTSNIYTQLGLLTLLGLITKHGILLVQFAQERRQKDTALSIEAAARIGAQERFRPIVMTTAAMIVGVLPLLFASGPGAVSRFHLGFIIVFGLGIGTLFTLFILPVIYTVAHETLADRE